MLLKVFIYFRTLLYKDTIFRQNVTLREKMRNFCHPSESSVWKITFWVENGHDLEKNENPPDFRGIR